MSGLVRTWEQSEAVRVTHRLKRSDVGTAEDMEQSEAVRITHQLETSDIGTADDMENKARQ